MKTWISPWRAAPPTTVSPRAGRGVRIRGGAPRSYYVGIETAGLAIPGMPRPLKALCVVPFGMEEGTEVEVPRPSGRPCGRRAGDLPLLQFDGTP